MVALMKELGVSERLGTLMEGESLLNDGTAIVMFTIFFSQLQVRGGRVRVSAMFTIISSQLPIRRSV